mgnify:CR=1 FL=1
MYVDEEVARQTGKFNYIESTEDITWDDVLATAKKISGLNLTGVVTIKEDLFEDLPSIVLQLIGYIQSNLKSNEEIDKTIICHGLQIYKQLFDLHQVYYVKGSDRETEPKALFTTTPTLFLSGGFRYLELPLLSTSVNICPSSAVFASIPKDSQKVEEAIDFISLLLSQRCQMHYNVMGVLRKDTSLIPAEGYAMFQPPQGYNQEIYIACVRNVFILKIDNEAHDQIVDYLDAFCQGKINVNQMAEHIVSLSSTAI